MTSPCEPTPIDVSQVAVTLPTSCRTILKNSAEVFTPRAAPPLSGYPARRGGPLKRQSSLSSNRELHGLRWTRQDRSSGQFSGDNWLVAWDLRRATGLSARDAYKARFKPERKKAKDMKRIET